MLVLTRKAGESIHLGDDIFIQVVEIGRGNVRLGIEAPKHIPIFRQEIFERIRQQNVLSAGGVSENVVKAAEIFRKKGLKE